eukprot:tig00001056_g6647.t1
MEAPAAPAAAPPAPKAAKAATLDRWVKKPAASAVSTSEKYMPAAEEKAAAKRTTGEEDESPTAKKVKMAGGKAKDNEGAESFFSPPHRSSIAGKQTPGGVIELDEDEERSRSPPERDVPSDAVKDSVSVPLAPELVALRSSNECEPAPTPAGKPAEQDAPARPQQQPAPTPAKPAAPATVTPATPAAPAPTAKKRGRPKKDAAAAAAAAAADGTATPAAAGPKKQRKRKPAAQDGPSPAPADGAEGPPSDPAAATPKATEPRKRKSKAAEGGAAPDGGEAGAQADGEGAEGAATQQPKKDKSPEEKMRYTLGQLLIQLDKHYKGTSRSAVDAALSFVAAEAGLVPRGHTDEDAAAVGAAFAALGDRLDLAVALALRAQESQEPQNTPSSQPTASPPSDQPAAVAAPASPSKAATGAAAAPVSPGKLERERKKAEKAEAARKKAEEKAAREQTTKRQSELLLSFVKASAKPAVAPASDGEPTKKKNRRGMEDLLFQPFECPAGSVIAPALPAARPVPAPAIGDPEPSAEVLGASLREWAAAAAAERRRLALQNERIREICEAHNISRASALRSRCKLIRIECQCPGNYPYKRPAYWGTYKRKSREVRARRWAGRDPELEYEVDSDDEFEDGDEEAGPCEDISNSEGEDDKDAAGADDEEGAHQKTTEQGYYGDEFLVPDDVIDYVDEEAREEAGYAAEADGGPESERGSRGRRLETLECVATAKIASQLGGVARKKDAELGNFLLGCLFDAAAIERATLDPKDPVRVLNTYRVRAFTLTPVSPFPDPAAAAAPKPKPKKKKKAGEGQEGAAPAPAPGDASAAAAAAADPAGASQAAPAPKKPKVKKPKAEGGAEGGAEGPEALKKPKKAKRPAGAEPAPGAPAAKKPKEPRATIAEPPKDAPGASGAKKPKEPRATIAEPPKDACGPVSGSGSQGSQPQPPRSRRRARRRRRRARRRRPSSAGSSLPRARRPPGALRRLRLGLPAPAAPAEAPASPELAALLGALEADLGACAEAGEAPASLEGRLLEAFRAKPPLGALPAALPALLLSLLARPGPLEARVRLGALRLLNHTLTAIDAAVGCASIALSPSPAPLALSARQIRRGVGAAAAAGGVAGVAPPELRGAVGDAGVRGGPRLCPRRGDGPEAAALAEAAARAAALLTCDAETCPSVEFRPACAPLAALRLRLAQPGVAAGLARLVGAAEAKSGPAAPSPCTSSPSSPPTPPAPPPSPPPTPPPPPPSPAPPSPPPRPRGACGGPRRRRGRLRRLRPARRPRRPAAAALAAALARRAPAPARRRAPWAGPPRGRRARRAGARGGGARRLGGGGGAGGGAGAVRARRPALAAFLSALADEAVAIASAPAPAPAPVA